MDVNRILKNYTEQITSLKEKIRKIGSDNKKVTNSLLDREDELRVLKKKYYELKEILNDKKLLESAELSKKLDRAENELNEQRSKCTLLERKYDLSEKNHKHEIGVEIAHHKETQKQLNKITQEMAEMKIKLEV